MTIEDVILSNDVRGIARLRDKLPADYCKQAARFILDGEGPVMILSGFYTGGWETDGPIGALLLGRALEKLGRKVYHVTDGGVEMMWEMTRGGGDRVIGFPVADHESSQKLARVILSDLRPGMAVAIERCGFTKDKRYLNMRGEDIGEHTAKMDYLFLGVERTVGIGDGGNEMGMGVIQEHIPAVTGLVKDPAATPASHLVIASIANWGAYGLLGYMSLFTGRKLLPSVGEEREMVTKWVDMGGVDGFSRERTYKVDGRTLDENSQALAALHLEISSNGTI